MEKISINLGFLASWSALAIGLFGSPSGPHGLVDRQGDAYASPIASSAGFILPQHNMLPYGLTIEHGDEHMSIEPTPTYTPTPTFTPTPTPTNSPTPTSTLIPTQAPLAPVDLDALFDSWGGHYGVDKELLRKIAYCESHFNAHATNGPYGGMYQFHPNTWQSTRTAMNLDPNPDLRFDAEESIKTAAFKISRGGVGAWPNCH